MLGAAIQQGMCAKAPRLWGNHWMTEWCGRHCSDDHTESITGVLCASSGYYLIWFSQQPCELGKKEERKRKEEKEVSVYRVSCSVPKLYLTLCNSMDYSTSGFPVLHHLPELDQTNVHWVGDVIQSSQPLPSPSSPAFYLAQHQGLSQWVSSSHQVAKLLELQLQHQWIFKVDFL